MGFLDHNILYLLFLVPFLIFLYILRLRRKVQIVSSNILWEQSIEDIKANTLFQRLRKNLLLPLQVLILALIIFALARPFIFGSISIARNIVVIIDASASMKAVDVKESRFDFAKSSIINIIDNLDRGVKMTIIRSADNPTIVCESISDKSILKDIIDKQKPSDTISDLTLAIKLADSLVKDIPKSEIIIFSDGTGNLQNQTIDVDVPVRFAKIGKESANNIAITNLDVIEEQSTNKALVNIRNYGIKSQSVAMEIYHNNNLIDVKKVSIPANEQRSVIFDKIIFTDGVLEASIDAKDDLSIDNKAYYVLHKPKQPKILLVGDNIFLEKALETLITKARLDKKDSVIDIIKDNYDLVIFDSFVPEIEPKTNAIYINPDGDLPYAKFLSIKKNPSVMNWDRSHPLMRFVDLSELRLDYVKEFNMPPWMKSIAESESCPLIWYGMNRRNGVIVLPFDIKPDLNRNFGLIPAFPIFISNALDLLMETKANWTNVKAGETIHTVFKEAGNQVLTVKKPNGDEVSSKLQNGIFTFTETDTVGIYQVIGRGIDEKFSVNLFNEVESDIRPSSETKVLEQKGQYIDLFHLVNREFWSILVLLGVILLILEWWVYHRRVLV
ncbi:MAG: vWA domain-containing protein [Candidatus Poribacteria bacterium]